MTPKELAQEIIKGIVYVTGVVAVAVLINLVYAWSLRSELATAQRLQQQMLEDVTALRQVVETSTRFTMQGFTAVDGETAHLEAVVSTLSERFDAVLSPEQLQRERTGEILASLERRLTKVESGTK